MLFNDYTYFLSAKYRKTLTDMKKNLPFIITMALFVVACVVVTIYSIDNQPQYIHFTPVQQTRVIDETIAPVNINTATAQELQTLSGIGEVIAGRIIAYREEVGAFLFIEEIMQVQGIAEGVFERIRDYIYVD
jgi:competence ComEA-like helix-hairpin-helix protein